MIVKKNSGIKQKLIKQRLSVRYQNLQFRNHQVANRQQRPFNKIHLFLFSTLFIHLKHNLIFAQFILIFRPHALIIFKSYVYV